MSASREPVEKGASQWEFTRDELLEAMTVAPCHITGTHDPTHTPRYFCSIQAQKALDGVLGLLGITMKDLPRRPHDYPSEADYIWLQRRAPVDAAE